MTGADMPSRLLVRDIAQLATPSGMHAPLRGPSLGEVDVLEDAFVLCEDGLVSAVGQMRELPELGSDVDVLDARGLSAVPGLVDCHTHACFGGDRVEEFSLRAAGASYEELHAAGGGILSTVRATREAGREGLREALRRHRGWMLAAGTTTFEAKSGYGLDRATEIASLEVIREEGGIPTFLGAHTVPPEFDDADAYLDFLLAEVLPAAAEVAEAADVFVERGAFDVGQARRYLQACREAGLALRLHGDQFMELGAVPLAVEVGARSVDHLEATGDTGIGTLAASDVVGVLLPASALFLDRPMPQAQAHGRRRCGDRPGDGLQSRKRVLREPPGRLLACVHAAPPLAGGGPVGMHGERSTRTRPCRPDRATHSRLRSGSRPPRCTRLALPRIPPGGAGRGGRGPGRPGGLAALG